MKQHGLERGIAFGGGAAHNSKHENATLVLWYAPCDRFNVQIRQLKRKMHGQSRFAPDNTQNTGDVVDAAQGIAPRCVVNKKPRHTEVRSVSQ